MTRQPLTTAIAVALASALVAPAALAQAATAAAAPSPAQLDRVEVVGEIIYRDRTEATAPVLSYDLAYFQRFEPLTVGDMLKRVPSVTFVSDVLEYDGVRLRGLDSGYTQILINGKRVPGAGLDRAFFVDRIPAEIVERIEIVRSASADRSGDAVAGALNIVLRDGYSIDGGYLRAGATQFNDDEFEPTFGAFWGGEALGGNLLVGANVQGRRNPKDKFSQRFDAPGGTLDNTEVQTDVRSGKDYAFNADYRVGVGETGELHLSGMFVRTDRIQDEDSIEYRSGIANTANLLTINQNDLDIQTDNYTLGAGLKWAMSGGETEIRLDRAGITDSQFEFENEFEYLRDTNPFPEDDRFTRDVTDLLIEDTDTTAEFAHERDADFGKLKFGLQATLKDRETRILDATRYRVTIPNAPGVRPAIPGPTQLLAPAPGGLNTIEETRFEPFVKLSGAANAMEWEAGLRYERTDTEINDRTVAPADARTETDYGFLLPSAHLRWNLDDANRITASVARTVRRPDFNAISPALLEAEAGDNDVLGNPLLDPESAWGLDVGFERRLGERGIVGVNLFYRDITDLVELANTGVEGSEGPGTFVLQPRNTGDGQVWGAEFDLSTPLSAIGLDNTGVFVNYSWLDSEIEDVFGKRRFNNQSNYVYNVGFIQELPSLKASFGVTFRKQGDAPSRIVGEEIITSYDGDLEAFIEKRFGKAWAVRLTGINLLDQSKDEAFDKFTTIADQISRDYDEYELETETGGRAVQLIVRYQF
ncbi:TonB-dependent receptor [Silanimonas sp.]|uniref:TonB-dependent receptor plug domain-containing protein n=1 Tax=Silanimonas sp. TaxID=1929290 RepID=UPI0022BC8247|nr:TonB-dependent receptor [Silanimonas sp.]MCZ8166807.1 TonB-dependent receptor [Silanimonas sp.]